MPKDVRCRSSLKESDMSRLYLFGSFLGQSLVYLARLPMPNRFICEVIGVYPTKYWAITAARIFSLGAFLPVQSSNCLKPWRQRIFHARDGLPPFAACAACSRGVTCGLYAMFDHDAASTDSGAEHGSRVEVDRLRVSAVSVVRLSPGTVDTMTAG